MPSLVHKISTFLIEYITIFSLGHAHRTLESPEQNLPLRNLKVHALPLQIPEGHEKTIVELQVRATSSLKPSISGFVNLLVEKML